MRWLPILLLAACAAPEPKPESNSIEEVKPSAAESEVEAAEAEARLGEAENYAEAARKNEQVAGTRFKAGVIDETAYLESVGSRISATTIVERRRLDVQETRLSGSVADSSITAPLVDGRDFALESYRIEERQARLFAKNAEAISRVWKAQFDQGLVHRDRWRPFVAAAEAAKVEVTRWSELAELRASKLRAAPATERAKQIDKRAKVAVAESRVRSAKDVLDDLRQQAGQGLIDANEVRNAEAAHREVQLELEQARKSR